jgi:hypothetical protein
MRTHDPLPVARMWHEDGSRADPARMDGDCWLGDLRVSVGAGEGNRTLMTSLEGWGSAIELRPRAFRPARNHPAASNVNTRSVPASRAYWPTALVPSVGPCARAQHPDKGSTPCGEGGPTSTSGLVSEKLAGRVGYGRLAGCGAAWLARLLWEQEAAGSNLILTVIMNRQVTTLTACPLRSRGRRAVAQLG